MDEIEKFRTEHELNHKCKVISIKIKDKKILEMSCTGANTFNTYKNYIISVSSFIPTLMTRNMNGTCEDVPIQADKKDAVNSILKEAISSIGAFLGQSGIYPLPPQYAKKLATLNIIK
jgi:hypothetical protein